jgi:hypothetical protein
MSEQEKYNLLVFDSTHHALAAEDLLKSTDYQLMIVPVPPQISANCGIAIRFNENQDAILSFIQDSPVEVAGYYQIIKDGLEKRTTRCPLS